MNTRNAGWVAALAGGAAAGVALADGPEVVYEAEPVAWPARIGHVYINVATGEQVVAAYASRSGREYWQNDDVAGSCLFFYGQDRPTRDTAASGRVKFGSAVVSWGDIPANSVINGYRVAYASNVGSGTVGSGIHGFNMINTFLDSYDGVAAPGGVGSRKVFGYIIEDIRGGDMTLGPGCDPGPCQWWYTIDLEGSGLEFVLGDVGAGAQDLDGDGLYDFAYTYSFEQNQSEAKGIAGPFLVRPSTLGGLGSATGAIDGFDWYNQLHGELTDYAGRIWFGGGSCPTTPYASLFMTLYSAMPAPYCGPIDYNGDGVVDFGDYLEFLNRYDALDPSADLNADGLVDFGDYLAFLDLYGACAG